MADSLPRFAPERPLPPYTYIPGKTPHPLSDPLGHGFGRVIESSAGLDAKHPERSPDWCYAVDLFQHGYYWEAHEVWEGLWHAAGRAGLVATWLKALIKWAAAGVKVREGRPEGARRHALRAAELVRSAIDGETSQKDVIAGFDVPVLLTLLDAAAIDAPRTPKDDIAPVPLAGWQLPWQPPTSA